VENGEIENDDARLLNQMIKTEAMTLRDEFHQRYPKSVKNAEEKEPEPTSSDEVVKPRVLVDALDEMVYLLSSFGTYFSFKSLL